MELDELIEEYSEELYSQFPVMLKYLDVINLFASYLLQVTDLLEEQLEPIEEYQTEVDFITLVEMSNEILSSMDSEFVIKFNQYLVGGTINLDDEEEYGFSNMSIDNGKIDIEIDRKYNIEDILGIIHEFFHAIHIEKFDNDLSDENWYIFTEAVALTGELYAIMYMYKHNIMKEDLNNYYKKLMYSILSHADTTLLTGLILEIYDKEQSINYENIEHFINIKKLPKEYKNIVILLEELDDFGFHISATYVFGFPIAMLISAKMIEDEKYAKKVNDLLKNINNYSLESLLTFLGIGDILFDEDFIYATMNFVHDVSSEIVNEEQLEIKKHFVEMR